ncbi:MAG: hypothetical protein Kapaf2KO_20620 [Candidatus Kapaibacteriales bacterium]
MKYIYFFFALILFTSCGEDDNPQPKEDTSSSNGEELAKQYCSGCHAYAAPDVLVKESWEKVLPAMRDFMGLYDNPKRRDSLLGNDPEVKKALLEGNIYPENPMLSEETYQIIYDYYINNAPMSIEKFIGEKVPLDQKVFKVREPEQRVKIPSTTMAYLNNGNIYIGDANTKSLSIFDRNLKLQKTGNVNEGAVWLNFYDNVMFCTVMGSFSPTDKDIGMVLAMPKEPGKQAQILVDKLRRPVHTATGDLDGNGMDDLVVSEFGYRTGSLSLFLNQGKLNFQEKKLYNKSGPIRSVIRDYDKDGDLDVITLIGQADEQITLFSNDGLGNFKSEKLIQLPPMYGSAYFDFVDYDSDGQDEIVYCNGDNADLSQQLKQFHGVHIFEFIDGKWVEDKFFQLNGAYKAIFEDFDLDGEKDLAAISVFPDFYNNPGEGFVLFENEGDGKYSRHSIEMPDRGRWIVMDSGDLDNDGDTDLVIGSLTMQVDKSGTFTKKWMDKGLPFIYLENMTK